MLLTKKGIAGKKEKRKNRFPVLDNAQRLAFISHLLKAVSPKPIIPTVKIARLKRLRGNYERLLDEHKERLRWKRQKWSKLFEIKYNCYRKKTKTGFHYLITKTIVYGKHRGEGPLMQKKLKTVPRNKTEDNFLTIKIIN